MKGLGRIANKMLKTCNQAELTHLLETINQ